MKINDFLLRFSKLFSTHVAYAHCDIPCGIYDPHAAQMAAHTVIRITQMINELTYEEPIESKRKFASQVARLTKVKEEHAETVKHEVRVLWGDYFKEEHLKKYPDLHNLVFKTMKLASRAKQEVNMEVAKELLEIVQKIAVIFFETKGVKSVRVKSLYPTGLNIVVQDVKRPS